MFFVSGFFFLVVLLGVRLGVGMYVLSLNNVYVFDADEPGPSGRLGWRHKKTQGWAGAVYYTRCLSL